MRRARDRASRRQHGPVSPGAGHARRRRANPRSPARGPTIVGSCVREPFGTTVKAARTACLPQPGDHGRRWPQLVVLDLDSDAAVRRPACPRSRLGCAEAFDTLAPGGQGASEFGSAQTVWVDSRRGRGASDDGPHDALEREVEDVLAVLAAAGDRAGQLSAIGAARRRVVRRSPEPCHPIGPKPLRLRARTRHSDASSPEAPCTRIRFIGDPPQGPRPPLRHHRPRGTLTDSDHRLLASWSASCAEHVLHLFESVQPSDPRPRQAIEQIRGWTRGEIRMRSANWSLTISGYETTSAGRCSTADGRTAFHCVDHTASCRRFPGPRGVHRADASWVALFAVDEQELVHPVGRRGEDIACGPRPRCGHGHSGRRWAAHP